MKKWLVILTVLCFAATPVAVIAKGGKGKGPNASDKAYENANDNAKFMRADDEAMGNGKSKGNGKDEAYDDDRKKMKEKKRHRKESKKRKSKKENIGDMTRKDAGEDGDMKEGKERMNKNSKNKDRE